MRISMKHCSMSTGIATMSTIGTSTVRAHPQVNLTRTGTGTRLWYIVTRTIPTCTTATTTCI